MPVNTSHWFLSIHSRCLTNFIPAANADETRAADAAPISPRKNLTVPLYDPRYARRFEMQIVWDVVAENIENTTGGKILGEKKSAEITISRGERRRWFRSVWKYFVNNVGEICRRNFNYVFSPPGRESLRLINIFARADIIKYDSKRGLNNSMFSIRDTRMIEIFFCGAGKI